MYKIKNDSIIKDGMTIPMVENNSHYKEYLAWVAEGNTAEDISTPAPTKEELDNAATIKAFESNVSTKESFDSEMVMKYVTKLNTSKGFTSSQKDSMMLDSDLSAILTMLMVAKRPRKAKSMIDAYKDQTYYTDSEKQSIVDYLTAKGY